MVETPEKETLNKIKFVLSCNNDIQAIRILEQYGFYKQNQNYSEEEVRKIIELSCEEGMKIQRTINNSIKIPYIRILEFKNKLINQFKNGNPL